VLLAGVQGRGLISSSMPLYVHVGSNNSVGIVLLT
jgi:hypothetical protein